MLQFAALIINKGVAFSQIVVVFAAIIPTFLEIALPMSALLGVMLAFARLSGDSEIIIIRASGVSLTQLLKPVIIFAFIIAAINIYVSLQLRPWGNAKLAQSFFEIARSKTTAGLNPGIFNKLGRITLYSEKINDTNGALEKVLIDDKRDENSRRIITAQTGQIISNPENRSIILALKTGDIHEESNNNYVLTHFTDNDLVIDFEELYRSAEVDHEKKSKEMYLDELFATMAKYKQLSRELKAVNEDVTLLPAELQETLKKDQNPTVKDLNRQIQRIKTEAGSRFSMPFATFILALLGMPLGIVPPRAQKAWGAGLSVLLGLAVFTIYYVLLSLGMTLGENGKISSYLGLWIPNLVAALVTGHVIHRICTERWYSIAHGLEEIMQSIWSKFKRKNK